MLFILQDDLKINRTHSSDLFNHNYKEYLIYMQPRFQIIPSHGLILLLNMAFLLGKPLCCIVNDAFENAAAVSTSNDCR